MKALLGRCDEPRVSREEDAGGFWVGFFSGHSWWQPPPPPPQQQDASLR